MTHPTCHTSTELNQGGMPWLNEAIYIFKEGLVWPSFMKITVPRKSVPQPFSDLNGQRGSAVPNVITTNISNCDAGLFTSAESVATRLLFYLGQSFRQQNSP